MLNQVLELRPVRSEFMEKPSTNFNDCLEERISFQKTAARIATGGTKPVAEPKFIGGREAEDLYWCQIRRRKLVTDKLIALQDSVAVREKAIADLKKYLEAQKKQQLQ